VPYNPGEEEDEDQEEESSGSSSWLIEDIVGGAIDTAEDIANGMMGLN